MTRTCVTAAEAPPDGDTVYYDQLLATPRVEEGGFVVSIDTPYTLHTSAHESLGDFFDNVATSFASNAWDTANNAYYVPFHVDHTIRVKSMALFNGTTVSGNFDLGIYDDDGAGGRPGTRLVSTGSTAQSGITRWQAADVADVDLAPGWYYLAAAMDNVVAFVHSNNLQTSASTPVLRMFGVSQESAAFPLPAVATPVALTRLFVPWVLATNQAVFA